MNAQEFEEKLIEMRKGADLIRQKYGNGKIEIRGQDGKVLTTTSADDFEKMIDEMQELVHLSQASTGLKD